MAWSDAVGDAKEESREVVEAFFGDHDHRNQTPAGGKAAASTRKASQKKTRVFAVSHVRWNEE